MLYPIASAQRKALLPMDSLIAINPSQATSAKGIYGQHLPHAGSDVSRWGVGTAVANQCGRTQKMPTNVVRTPEEEIAWRRAKARAREEYPDAKDERFYRVAMAIYKKLINYKPLSSGATAKAAAARRMR